MKKRMLVFLSLLVMLALACNLSGTPATQVPGSAVPGNDQSGSQTSRTNRNPACQPGEPE